MKTTGVVVDITLRHLRDAVGDARKQKQSRDAALSALTATDAGNQRAWELAERLYAQEALDYAVRLEMVVTYAARLVEFTLGGVD